MKSNNDLSEYDIFNISVKFPYKAYASQLSMMSRIVDSLNNKNNCLLESPTGTGKTMALLCSTISWLEFMSTSKNEKDMPKKIFYCTRTHKQVTQVVRELSKSPYHETKMTVLSSRRYSCINKSALESKNIDQACSDLCSSTSVLNKIPSCPYQPIKQDILLPGSWDLESIKPKLKAKKQCPYYQSRDWMTQAEIVLCPYNYILHPSIRDSTQINLKNAIVIIDEAHNVEDVCRDSGSCIITQEELEIGRIQLFNEAKKTREPLMDDILELIDFILKLIKALSIKLYFKFDDVKKKTWSSKDVALILQKHGFDCEKLKKFQACIDNILDKIKAQNKGLDEDEEGQSSMTEMIGQKIVIDRLLLNKLFQFMWIANFLVKEHKGCQEDFRIVVSEGEEYVVEDGGENSDNNSDKWLSSAKRKRNSKIKTNLTLNMWCMNPKVIFHYLVKKSHSLILTSGTLAPQTSFHHELNCLFASTLEAFHVVQKSQTFVASIGHGPNGQKLEAVYGNVGTCAFQDELGRLILQCCKTVPNGILCFLSSFNLIDTLCERWISTGLMDQLAEYKTVLYEPKSNEDMKKVMEHFYAYKAEGVLMLAVFRGKVSEGMDFSDDAARLVISVGIPYPSIKDPQVILKKQFNDELCKIRAAEDHNGAKRLKPINGSEWYKIQAFRALNQAIGRCIRHRHDWGCILLVDSRFNSSINGVCRWLKDRVVDYSNWGPLQMDMEYFIKSQSESNQDKI